MTSAKNRRNGNISTLTRKRATRKIFVEKDPTDPENRVRQNYGHWAEYLPKADGREEWRDYIWDFDWLWENDSFVGMVYRVEGGIKGAESHFHGSRRTGGQYGFSTYVSAKEVHRGLQRSNGDRIFRFHTRKAGA